MTVDARRPLRRFSLAALAALALPAASATAADSGGAPMLGFSETAAVAERAREARLDSTLDPAAMRAWLERLAARPHHVGSPAGRANAEWLRDQFASWGYEARIESFDVLFP